MSRTGDSLASSPCESSFSTAKAEASPNLKLGLIGDNIAHSNAPLLHRLAGTISGIAVSYERLVPRELGSNFDESFAGCAAGGYRGINVTYPYKERAAHKVQIDDPVIRAIGAVNTVVFELCGPKGSNTDYSGFIAAYRDACGKHSAGSVCIIGAGGVGKAIAFALLRLGLKALWIIDVDRSKATDLASRLRIAAPGLSVTTAEDAGVVTSPVDGLVNCTPVGMVGHEGTPLVRERMQGARWAFDAVYTPLETQFLVDAAAEGLTVISGYELFFHQGVEAWQIFAGQAVDPGQLRSLLTKAGAGPQGSRKRSYHSFS